MPPEIDLSPRVYVRIKPLPDGVAALVQRAHGATMIYCDPRAERIDIFMACDSQLTSLESAVCMDAYGLPRRGEKGDMSGTVNSSDCLLYVPPAVRYPGDSALQGGEVVHERIELGLLREETVKLLLERGQRAG